MAIDSRRKRASVASLGLAFLGASVVPDGSFVQGDRQAIGYSYYGINAGAGIVTIGGTSQLEAFTSTGGITLERVIGGTSQLEAFTSTGGITLERTLGGTSQLAAFTSSGTIQVGDTPVVVNPRTSGGGRIYVPPAPAKKKRKPKQPEPVKAESTEPRESLDTELGAIQSRIEPTEPEIPPFPFGETLKNLENAPVEAPPLDPEALTDLIASMVETQVSQALSAEQARQDGLKVLAVLEAELEEGEPLDPRIEEFLLLLLLV